MGRLGIRLLGPPALVHEGGAVPSPRGAKPWALLAHLLLSGQALPLLSASFCDVGRG